MLEAKKTKYGLLRIGDVFKYLTILHIPPKGSKVEAQCICGHIKLIRYAKLFAGDTKSCGCKRNCLRQVTNLKTYGVEHVAQHPDIRAKTEETNMNRYGGTAPSQNSTIRAKMENTTLERHGARHSMQTQQGLEKYKSTMRKNYGVENPRHCPVINKKIEDTCLEYYGGISPFASIQIQEKSREKLIEKYGVDNPSKDLSVKERRKETLLDRYGVEYYSQSSQHKEEMIQRGLWLDYSKVDRMDFELFLREVWNITERTVRRYPEEFWGRGKELHVDHIYSISQGYLDKINPEILGSRVNLRLLEATKNITKRRNCDISKEMLIALYKEQNK